MLRTYFVCRPTTCNNENKISCDVLIIIENISLPAVLEGVKINKINSGVCEKLGGESPRIL